MARLMKSNFQTSTGLALRICDESIWPAPQPGTAYAPTATNTATNARRLFFFRCVGDRSAAAGVTSGDSQKGFLVPGDAPHFKMLTFQGLPSTRQCMLPRPKRTPCESSISLATSVKSAAARRARHGIGFSWLRPHFGPAVPGQSQTRRRQPT